ncbi:hypothetical protein PanWU01x14_118580 [Parasponia andersonii]|uniref:Uncharacterized protein n=1 Tax=Parasponia andersonii TaxID=3476 RepID=A0A2P5CVS0_PARAD|nr:hypothetical protein PanWU01x14_118580 [Parasponia andersonii]
MGGLWWCMVAHGSKNADLGREKLRVCELSLVPTSRDGHRRWMVWHRPDVRSLLLGARVPFQRQWLFLGAAQ